MLDKLLTGKALAVRPFITEIREGMRGGSAPRDLETMFQLIYLRFTAPRADPTAFAAMKAQALAMLANQTASPDVALQSGARLCAERQPSAAPARVAGHGGEMESRQVARVLQGALRRRQQLHVRLRRQLHARDRCEPLVETYVASLPATRARETWRDLGVTPPAGVVQTTVRKGIAPKSEVSIVFTGPFEDSASEPARAADGDAAAAGAAERRDSRAAGCDLRDLPPSRRPAGYPRPEYRVTINWTCDPAQVESLVQRVFQEVAAVRNTPLTADQMVRVRDFLQRDLERASQENGYLLSQLLRHYENGEPLTRRCRDANRPRTSRPLRAMR